MDFGSWDRADTVFAGVFLLAALMYFGVLLTSGDRSLLILPLAVQVVIGVAWVGKHTLGQ